VTLQDGGTQGLALYEYIAAARRVLVFDAIDYKLPPGTLKVLRDDEVPAWGRTKLSPHQLGFNDVLGLARIRGRGPDTIVAIGVQPLTLEDFELDPETGTPRPPGAVYEPLNAGALDLERYESERPSDAEALRIGDPRVVLARRTTEG
jgi:hydrogenase maturation protease